jgi:hypothetical protein
MVMASLTCDLVRSESYIKVIPTVGLGLSISSLRKAETRRFHGHRLEYTAPVPWQDKTARAMLTFRHTELHYPSPDTVPSICPDTRDYS